MFTGGRPGALLTRSLFVVSPFPCRPLLPNMLLKSVTNGTRVSRVIYVVFLVMSRALVPCRRVLRSLRHYLIRSLLLGAEDMRLPAL